MNSIAITLLNGFADTLEKISPRSTEGAVLVGVATMLRVAADILTDRTPEEAVALLEMIKAHGAKPVTASELDAQVQATLDKAGR